MNNARAEEATEYQNAIATLHAWRAALHSVSLIFETTNVNGVKTVVEWDWSEDGSIREHTYYDWGPHRRGYRSAWLFTGGTLYSLRYPEGKSDYGRPKSVEICNPNCAVWECIVTPLYGLWWNRSRRWLPDELGTMTEWLPPADGRLVAVVMSKLRLELNPEQGYLPVDATSFPGKAFHNVVHEFETVAPGILFPKRGIFITTTKEPLHGSTRDETRWELTSIRINDPGTATNFRLPRVPIWNRGTVLFAAAVALLVIGGIWLLMQALLR